MQPGYVYIVHGIGTAYIKVGKTTNILKRLQQINNGVPFPIRLLYAELVQDMDTMEHAIKSRYIAFHVHGEWCELSPEALALWPPYTPEPREQPRLLKIVQPRPTLRERILTLMEQYQQFTVRGIQRHLFSASAKEIKTVFRELVQEGRIVSTPRGRTVVFSLMNVA